MPESSNVRQRTARLDRARVWLQTRGFSGVELKPVAGDASARRYFRFRRDENSYLLMDADPEQESVDRFLQVTERLHAVDLPAPEIFAENPEQGFLVLEDFGDRQLRDVLNYRSVNRWWPPVFDLLTQMATTADPEGLPDYSADLLQQELDLFPDWYLNRHRNIQLSTTQKNAWKALCEKLTLSALHQPQVFVHRDFHSCNLMVTGTGKLGLIDYQDAVRGPVSYDLMSILLDRYISWPRDLLEGWMQLMRRQLAPDIALEDWVRMCDWMGLQRNLKIIGIFARLKYRDGKAGYIELIPRFAGYVLDVTGRHSELQPAQTLLEELLCTP